MIKFSCYFNFPLQDPGIRLDSPRACSMGHLPRMIETIQGRRSVGESK